MESSLLSYPSTIREKEKENRWTDESSKRLLATQLNIAIFKPSVVPRSGAWRTLWWELCPHASDFVWCLLEWRYWCALSPSNFPDYFWGTCPVIFLTGAVISIDSLKAISYLQVLTWEFREPEELRCSPGGICVSHGVSWWLDLPFPICKDGILASWQLWAHLLGTFLDISRFLS